jgi:hypothetical protein
MVSLVAGMWRRYLEFRQDPAVRSGKVIPTLFCSFLSVYLFELSIDFSGYSNARTGAVFVSAQHATERSQRPSQSVLFYFGRDAHQSHQGINLITLTFISSLSFK